MNISLKKFDVKRIRDDSTVVLIGKRDTGKSYLVRDILYYKQHIPVGTVISATESANRFYQQMVPGRFIHEEFNPAIVHGVLKRQ